MRIALVLNDDFSMWHFRKGLISALCKRGCQVYTVTPGGPYVKDLEELGAVHRNVPLYRFVKILPDLRLIWALYRTFRQDRIDIVHNMTVKPTIYGAIAARLARIQKVVALVSGVGLPFMEGGGWRRRVLRALVTALYRVAFRITDRVWFQNPDDRSFFVALGLLPEEKTIVIRGGGINVDEFSAESVDSRRVKLIRDELGLGDGTKAVLMIVARLIWSKGVKEFIEAAEILRNQCPEARFLLIGPYDRDHPDAIPVGYLERRESPNFRVHVGFREDVREILSLADVVVLPSYFREGVPRVLLEALSLGKPVVTTDHPGCREVVDDGENGFLVPVKDSKALANSIAMLLENSSLRSRFGKHSRCKAESEFDEKSVVEKIITQLYGLES